jgi:integrase
MRRGSPQHPHSRSISRSPRCEAARKANPKVVQRMLGHASAAMTLDVYADLFDTDLDSVAERLDSGWHATGPRARGESAP